MKTKGSSRTGMWRRAYSADETVTGAVAREGTPAISTAFGAS